MAGFLTEIMRVIGKGKVVVAGSWRPNGSGTLDATQVRGKGFSVAYTSTGLWTITFDKPWTQLTSFVCTLQMGTPAAQVLCMGAYSSSAKTVIVTNFTSGSLADIASATHNRIHFVAVFKNTLAPG